MTYQHRQGSFQKECLHHSECNQDQPSLYLKQTGMSRAAVSFSTPNLDGVTIRKTPGISFLASSV